jgi:hypothetical protein
VTATIHDRAVRCISCIQHAFVWQRISSLCADELHFNFVSKLEANFAKIKKFSARLETCYSCTYPFTRTAVVCTYGYIQGRAARRGYLRRSITVTFPIFNLAPDCFAQIVENHERSLYIQTIFRSWGQFSKNDDENHIRSERECVCTRAVHARGCMRRSQVPYIYSCHT